MTLNFPSSEIYLFLVTEDKYGKIRKIDGCKNLIEIPATKTDAKYIKKIADQMGIPTKNRFIQVSPNMKNLKESF